MLLVLAATAHAAPCDKAGVAKIVDALPQVDADQQPFLAAAGIADACTGGLAAAAQRVSMVGPDQSRLVDAQAALDDLAGWMKACPGGPGALAQAMQLEPGSQRAHLWSACRLEGRGWFDASEWNGAKGLIVLPLIAGVALADSGVAPADARVVVRALVGIAHPGTKPREPMLPYLPIETIPPPPVFDEGGVEGGVLGGVVGGGGLGGLGDIGGSVARDAGFAPGGRVEPDWSKAARTEGGRCVARIGVTPAGDLRKVVFVACPEALRKDVERAIGRSRLDAAVTADGAAGPGRFEATYEVGSRE